MSDKNSEQKTAEPAQQPAKEPEATTATEPKTKAEPKTAGRQTKGTKGESGKTALKSVGLEACKRHGLPEVWVTADGQCFALENDAKAHAANLADKELLNVKAK